MASRTPHDVGRALPIWQQRDTILDAFSRHRVIVVDGPPGCGKTTQLPQMLREAGVLARQMGITQPRRIAATSVAQRIADEMGVQVGEEVGYAIRFDDSTSPRTQIKVMTDGILLQETRGDEALSAYDVIMVDEAHERSLNIDFTLGLLLQAMQLRPSLKVVVSSATLPPGEMEAFFAPVASVVPVVRIHSRTFPIDVRHADWPQSNSPDALAEAVVEQLERVFAQTHEGHVLVFFPGEAAILRTQEALRARPFANTRVLALFGRLPQREQALVFDEELTRRKIVLSTNIAETSITIDGVRAVIDLGLQKLPYFQARTGVQALREEMVSRASAEQRAGRAGRTGPGLVVRLYPKSAMEELPAFGREEILRIDLSEAVLRLVDLGIRDVEEFALPTPPPPGKIRAALAHLHLLGAIDSKRRLTPVGQKMVHYPLTPALARMVVEALELFPEALNDVLIVGALLSVRSPFTYPAGQEEAARQAKSRLRHPSGDALTLLGAYHRFVNATDRPAFCKINFLEPDAMAFIVRAHAQLQEIAVSRGARVPARRAQPEAVLQCLLAGFADKVLRKTNWGYQTLQEVDVSLHPSSVLYGSRHPYLVANELVQSGHRGIGAFGVSAVQQAWLARACPEAARRWGADARPRTPERAPPGEGGPPTGGEPSPSRRGHKRNKRSGRS